MLSGLARDFETLGTFPPFLTHSLKYQDYSHISKFSNFKLVYDNRVYNEVLDFLRKANGLQPADKKLWFADNFSHSEGKIVFHTANFPDRYFNDEAMCYVITNGACSWETIPYTPISTVYGPIFSTIQRLRQNYLDKLGLVNEVVNFLESTKPSLDKVLVGKFLHGGGWFDHKVLEYSNLRLYALAEQKLFDAFVPKDIDKSSLYILHINQKVSSSNGTLYYVSALDTLLRVIRSYHIMVPVELPVPVTMVKLDKIPLHAHKSLYNFVEEVFSKLKNLLDLSLNLSEV